MIWQAGRKQKKGQERKLQTPIHRAKSAHPHGIPIYDKIASSTIPMTTSNTMSNQSFLRPAFRWYSCAVVSSRDASAVWVPTEVILLSMLSVPPPKQRLSLVSPRKRDTEVKEK